VRETSINAKNCGQIGAFCKMVSEAMDKHYSTNDDFALVLGGDHSVPIGTLPPLIRKRPNTGIVWVDAHADSEFMMR
jgi:arginase